MGAVYRFLGYPWRNLRMMDQGERQRAYQADVIYGTNSEFGF
jgi:preprotein translocase subunit SecA